MREWVKYTRNGRTHWRRMGRTVKTGVTYNEMILALMVQATAWTYARMREDMNTSLWRQSDGIA